MAYTYAGHYGPQALEDAAGLAFTSIDVEVFESDGVTTATLYSDRLKAIPKANPFTAPNGNVSFYAEPGQYVMVPTYDTLAGDLIPITVPVDPQEAVKASTTSLVPIGNLVAEDVQAAIQELDDEKVARAWLPFFHVESYRTAGMDDRTAIQAACDAAKAAGGGIVLLKNKTYTIVRPVVVGSNVCLKGSGMGATKITKPATVKSLLTANAALNATSVTVADASGFALGDPVHLYDTASFEWLSTQGRITDKVGNVLTFTDDSGSPGLDGALQTARAAAATTSFPLIRNEVGATNIRLEDFTLDQAANASDPNNDFTLAAIHWVEAYRARTERVEILNAAGDAYSDQAQDGTGVTLDGTNNKTTKNTIQGCRVRNAGRHGVHLGTGMNGGYVLDNEITSCASFGFFYCAYVTNTVARGNLIESCGSGFAGIDHRDTGNVISNNVIRNVTSTAIDAYSSGSSTGVGGRLTITGNSIFLTAATFYGIRVDQPDCTIANNTVEMGSSVITGILLQGDADRCVLSGNIVKATSASGQRGIGLSSVDDPRLIGNVMSGMQNAAHVSGVSRLVAYGNYLSGTARGWWFDGVASTDCVIKDERNTFATPVTESTAPVRLVYEGLGTNGANDPASAGSWNGISGRRFDGTIVHWNAGAGDRLSLFKSGVGWIPLN